MNKNKTVHDIITNLLLGKPITYPKLISKYKTLFSDEFTDIRCEVGWTTLIVAFVEYLASFNKFYKTKVKISTIKEKFGQLRIYLDDVPKEYAERLIGVTDTYIHLSSYICEKCGSTDKVAIKPSAYLQSLCLKCRKEKANAKA